MKNILIMMLLLCLSTSAMAQTIIYTNPKLDPTRILVFFPDRDIPPPYGVTGELNDLVIRLYINGIPIMPDSRQKENMPPKNQYGQGHSPSPGGIV